MDSAYQVVLCTCPDTASAQSLGKQLVKEQLAACVQILPPMTAIYRWQGAVETQQELLLIIKTTQDCFPQLAQFIQTHHPYEVPQVVALPITQGLAPYLKWIDDNTGEAP